MTPGIVQITLAIAFEFPLWRHISLIREVNNLPETLIESCLPQPSPYHVAIRPRWILGTSLEPVCACEYLENIPSQPSWPSCHHAALNSVPGVLKPTHSAHFLPFRIMSAAATTTQLSPMTSKARTPRTARDKGAPSPNYFNPLVSPQSTPADPQPSLEAFRRQSESNNFSLGHNNLPFFSSSSGSRNVSAESSPVGPGGQEDVLSPLTLPRGMASVEKGTHIAEPMEVDPPSPHTSRPPPSKPLHFQSLSATTPSFFDIPRQQSPFAASPADLPPRNHASHIDERHARNSLPHNRIDPPSPAPRGPVQRAETLPNALSTDAPNMISPQELSEILRSYVADDVLLLDVRVFPQYSQSRIDGALNLCIPTTLLKRPAFNVQKLADTFNREKEKAKFARWREAKAIVVYDASSVLLKDATSAVNTLKKFKNEGWHGSACIVRGGFLGYAKKFPSSIDERPASEMESTQGRKLTIDPSKPLGAPVAGGCVMPAEKSSVNPFFGSIRQNMDLIGGVGQIPIPLPSGLRDNSRFLPLWLKRVTSPRDRGKSAADCFLAIEQGEQQRMQKALNGKVHYGTTTITSPDTVRIAGIEKGAKNRYKDMLPYDHSRVRLQNVPAGECDYINASHIKSSLSGRHYIASQAPVPATIEVTNSSQLIRMVIDECDTGLLAWSLGARCTRYRHANSRT